MRIYGRTDAGSNCYEIASDTKRVAAFSLPESLLLSKLSAYLDGFGYGDVPGVVTVAGNEITDVTRAATFGLGTGSSGQMIDGLLNDSSFGIRRAATNLFGHGQNDAVGAAPASFWSKGSSGTVTITTDATVPAPYSTQSMKYVTDGTFVNQSVLAWTATGQAVAAGTSCVGSIYFKGTPGTTYVYRLRMLYTDTTTDFTTNTSFVATGSYQLLIASSGVVAVGKTADRLAIEVYNPALAPDTFWAAHVMLEKGQSVVAPYVATSGGATATHAAGRVQAPAALLSTSQGWMAARLRMGYGSAAGLSTAPGAFVLNDGSNNNRIGLYNVSGSQWQSRRVVGGVGGTAAVFNAPAWSAGDFLTVALKWDATTISISINGAAWVTVANGSTFVPTTLDIGSGFGTGNWIDSDVLWFACGTGTDADAAALNALGNTDPTIPQVPGSWTMIWPAQTVAYTGAGSVGEQALKAVIYDASDNLLAESDELVVQAQQPPDWQDFTFTGEAGKLMLPSGRISFGVHGGGFYSNVARIYGDDPRGAGGKRNADTYSDGASLVFGAATTLTSDMSIFVTAQQPYSEIAPVESDFYLARLPWAQSQDQLAVGGAVPQTGRVVDLGWHTTFLDPETGANVIVRADSVLASLLGERIKITTQGVAVPRVAYAYVHDLADPAVLPWEISATRAVFSQLGMLASDSIPCVVEVIG